MFWIKINRWRYLDDVILHDLDLKVKGQGHVASPRMNSTIMLNIQVFLNSPCPHAGSKTWRLGDVALDRCLRAFQVLTTHCLQEGGCNRTRSYSFIKTILTGLRIWNTYNVLITWWNWLFLWTVHQMFGEEELLHRISCKS